MSYRTRSLGGTLLVIKDSNDCVTIERDGMSKPKIIRIEGAWSTGELKVAKKMWNGSEAQKR